MIINTNQKPKIPEGYNWTIERHEKNGKIDLSKLALHLEPEQKESYIKGEVLAERMKDKGLNANVLDYLLEHPDLIPEEWKGKYIFFWGTIYRYSDGYLYIRYLFWFDGLWHWYCYWIDDVWFSHSPAAVLCKSSPQNSEPLHSCPQSLALEKRITRLETKLADIFESAVAKIAEE